MGPLHAPVALLAISLHSSLRFQFWHLFLQKVLGHKSDQTTLLYPLLEAFISFRTFKLMMIQLQTTVLQRRTEPVSDFLGQMNSNSFSEVISGLPSVLPSREAEPVSGLAPYYLYFFFLTSAWHIANA